MPKLNQVPLLLVIVIFCYLFLSFLLDNTQCGKEESKVTNISDGLVAFISFLTNHAPRLIEAVVPIGYSPHTFGRYNAKPR